MPVGSSLEWKWALQHLRRYVDNSITDRVSVCRGHEGYFAVARIAVFVGFGVVSYAWPQALWLTAPFTAVLLADALLIVTSHAFGLAGPATNAFRFVILNLLGFLSLTPCVAVFLAIVSTQFDPPLTWLRAIEVSFVATTGSNSLAPAQSHYWLASRIVGAATVCALYYVFVFLVVAVDHAQRAGDRWQRPR